MKKLASAFFTELFWRIKHFSFWPYKVWEVPVYHNMTITAYPDGTGTMVESSGVVKKKRLRARFFTEAGARNAIKMWDDNQGRPGPDVILKEVLDNSRTFVVEVHYI